MILITIIHKCLILDLLRLNMISISHLYNIVEEDRKKLFSFFQKIDEKHFYFSPKDRIWSSELIFRHLLMNIKWMLNKLPGVQIEESILYIY